MSQYDRSRTSVSGDSQFTTQKLLERGKSNCQICHKKFGMFNREHVCKRCFRNVDEQCSKNNKYIIGYDIEPNKKHKVCNICYKESKAQKDLHKELKLKFAQDSNVTKIWFSQIKSIKSDDQITQEFNQCLQVTSKMQHSKAFNSYVDMMSQMQRKLEDNYKDNFSYTEFYHYLTEDIAQGEVHRIIGDVLKAFLHFHCDDIGFNRDVYDLAVFLLMFFSPPKAWAVLCYIYEKIVPEDCHPANFQKNNFRLRKESVSFICAVLQDRFKIQTNVIPKIKEFLEAEGLDYFSSFCLGKVNIQASFFILDYILGANDQFLALVRVICCIIAHNYEAIQVLGAQTQSHRVQRLILEDTELDDIKKKVDFQIQRPPGYEYIPGLLTTESVTVIKRVEIPQQQQQVQITQVQQSSTLEIEIEALRKELRDKDMTIQKLDFELSLARKQSQQQQVGSSSQNDQAYQELVKQHEALIQQTNNYKSEIYEYQQQITKIQESHKLKLQQDRTTFQQEYETIQDEYEALEKRFLIACQKIMLLSAQTNMSSNRNQEQVQVEEVNRNRRGTLAWQSEIGVLTVKLNNKEKECERIKKSLRDLEDKYDYTVRKIKEEYEGISAQELKKVTQKFDIERQYYEEDIARLRQRISDLEAYTEDFDNLKQEYDRLSFMQSSGKGKFDELEKENLKNLDEIDRLRNLLEKQQIDYENQIELIKKQQLQGNFDQKLQKYMTEIEILKIHIQEEKQKTGELCKRYILQSLELQRQNRLNYSFYQQIQELRIDNEHFLKQLKESEQKLQMKDSQYASLEQEMTSFKMFSTQVQKQDQSGKISILENQINELNEKIRKLLEENSSLKFELENLRVIHKTTENDLEFANSKLEKIYKQHDEEIQSIKDDYEQVIAHTVQTCNEKIQRIEADWKRKEAEWKDKEIQYKSTIAQLEEKIAMLTLELKQCQETIERLEEKIALLTSELKQKTRHIEELNIKISEMTTEIESLKLKIEKLEERLAATIHELKQKNEYIAKLEIQISDFKKEIELKNQRIEELENKIAMLAAQLRERDKTIQQLEHEKRELQIKYEDCLKRIEIFEERCAYYEIEMEKKRWAYVRITMLCLENKRLQQTIYDLQKRIDEYLLIISQKDKRIEELEAKIKSLEIELENWRKNMASYEMEITTIRQQYASKLREALKRYVLVFTELNRQNDVISVLQDKIKLLNSENKKLTKQVEDFMEEVSDARLELENLKILKKQLSKKNLELTNLQAKHDNLTYINKKTLMRLLIVSLELERSSTLNNNLLFQSSSNRSQQQALSGRAFQDESSSIMTSTTIIRGSQSSSSQQK